MKKFLSFSFAAALALACASSAAGQTGTVAKGPTDPTVLRDPELEKEALHNLEVARHYFKQKKAYTAALARCEETIAGYEQFSRLDEVLYIAGASSLYLSEGKGKQRSKLPADKLRDDARVYLTRLVNDFPESEFRKDAEEKLQALKQ